MAKLKHIDKIDMSFTDTPNATEPEPAPKPEDVEELKENGQLVYQKNKKTGDIKFYVQEDGKDVEVDLGVIDRIESGYPPIPERNFQGAKKKGALQVRYVAEKFNEEKLANETVEVPEAECELIVERQDYESGDSITNTITKKHHNLVKMLRGEISAVVPPPAGGQPSG